MLRAFKYRIYPNVTQRILLNKTFGSVRFLWNRQVEDFNKYDKESKIIIPFKSSTEIRNEFLWMKEISAAALQQKEIDFKEFKKQYFSKTRKTIVGRPAFKKKSNRQSFRLPNQKFKILDGKIRLEKIGWIKFVEDRVLPNECKMMSVTISKDPTNRYFASVVVDTEIKKRPATTKTIGIDVGIKTFSVFSDGLVICNPKYFRESQAKLKWAQRNFSKKKNGSSRYIKNRVKVAKIHRKIASQRDFFLHNTSTFIVNNYDLICIEDLNISGMVKNRSLSKSISDASFSRFFEFLEYKCKWYGKDLIKIPRFAPSSKMCSNCGTLKKDLRLSDRIYVCDCCNIEIDRDLNAAKNIKAIGVEIAKRAQREHKTCLQAITDEALRVP